jgi:hypothetical protein
MYIHLTKGVMGFGVRSSIFFEFFLRSSKCIWKFISRLFQNDDSVMNQDNEKSSLYSHGLPSGLVGAVMT